MSPAKIQAADLFDVLNNVSGQRIKYKELCEMLLNSATKDNVIIDCLTYLKDNIYVLDNDKEQFVNALLRMNWLERNEIVNTLYKEVILNLVSAHTYYLSSVLKMIILKFHSDLNSNEDKNHITSENIETFHKLHILLKKIISIAPMASNLVISLIIENYPYIKKNTYCHLCYVDNILTICKYLRKERKTILELVINKMLDIDVHCPKSDIEEAELEENLEVPMETDQEIEENTRMKHPLANTLDCLMERLFDFIDDVCNKKDSNLNWDATKKLYKEFLILFDELILPTHACVHVQFIMFYICSFRWSLCEGFIDYLWKKVQNLNLPSVIRQVCASYIGSFLARAQYITINAVKDVLDIMTNWLHKYINSQSENAQFCVDTIIHGTFYSVCQTVFYIFIFHHKELIETKGMKYIRKLNFDRIINCRLNPLKVCTPAVVTNFAKITKNYQIVYCYTIIEQNNRSIIPVVARTSCGIMQSINITKLDSYFPFDPYILKNSGKKIELLFRHYEQLKEEHNEIEDEEFIAESTSTTNVLPDILEHGTSCFMNTVMKDR